MVPEWLYSTLVLVAGLHLLLVLLAARAELDGDGSLGATAGRDVAADGDEISCPQCGQPNERGYRYCAHCVAELPAASAAYRVPGGLQRRESI